MNNAQHVTFDNWTVLISWILQSCQSQHSVHPHNRNLVSKSLQHTIIDLVIQIIIYLGVFSQVVKNFVNQLTDSKPHCLVTGRMILQRMLYSQFKKICIDNLLKLL